MSLPRLGMNSYDLFKLLTCKCSKYACSILKSSRGNKVRTQEISVSLCSKKQQAIDKYRIMSLSNYLCCFSQLICWLQIQARAAESQAALFHSIGFVKKYLMPQTHRRGQATQGHAKPLLFSSSVSSEVQFKKQRLQAWLKSQYLSSHYSQLQNSSPLWK